MPSRDMDFGQRSNETGGGWPDGRSFRSVSDHKQITRTAALPCTEQYHQAHLSIEVSHHHHQAAVYRDNICHKALGHFELAGEKRERERGGDDNDQTCERACPKLIVFSNRLHST